MYLKLVSTHRFDERLAALVGQRVSLRRRIRDDDGPGPRFTDAVGDLADGGDGTFVVHARSGPVRVRAADVVALRAVPPARPRRPSWAAVSRLEQLCADAWPPVVRRDLGGWRLRAADGFTHRANSALAAADPGTPVSEALAAVRAFAAEHRIPPVVATPEGSPWSHRVQELGWELEAGRPAGSELATLVADLEVLARTGPADGPEVTFDAAPAMAWWGLFGEGPDDPDAATRERVLVPGPDGPESGFGLARRAGPGIDRVLGAVRATVVEDHVYLSRLHTDPSARRTGVAARLTADAAAWGRQRGARFAVLQVALRNEAARALYARLGATEHHRYHYLVPGPDASA
ncbi:MAG: GNAT family N-acetyltransferase [Pseudonocardia sp.]|nr:GNAT family N-acetyltransferase [Pseudonocardia sp.]